MEINLRTVKIMLDCVHIVGDRVVCVKMQLIFSGRIQKGSSPGPHFIDYAASTESTDAELWA